MAVFHLKTGGSKTSGASTASDWTDANCYGTFADWMGALDSASDGDEGIVNDEIFVTAANFAGGINFNGTLTIKSKSGDASISGIKSSSATGALWLINSTTHSCNLIFQDLTLGKTVTHTDTARPVVLHATQRTGNITFQRCEFSDIDIAIASGANWYYGIVTPAMGAGYGTTCTFEDCEWSNISGTFAANGAVLASASGTAYIMRLIRPVLRNITAHNHVSGFNCSAGSQLLFWDVDLDGWTGTSDTGIGCGAVLKISSSTGAAKMYGRGATMRNCTQTAESPDALINTTAPYDVQDIVATSVTVNASTKSLGLGAIFIAIGSTAFGRLENIRAYDCHANYGTAAYWSNGASGVARNIVAEQCSVGMGMVYKGGDGDLTASQISVRRCWQRDDVGLDVDALAFYGHIHAATGARDSSINLRDVLVDGNTYQGSAAAVLFNNPNATYTVNGTAERVTVRDSAVGILMDGAAVNLTATDCNLVGGVGGIVESQASGSLTASGTVDTAVYPSGSLSAAMTLASRWPAGVRP